MNHPPTFAVHALEATIGRLYYAMLRASVTAMLMRKHGRGARRLVSAVAALALVVAHLVGGYAHAAGHNAAKGHAALHQHDTTAAIVLVAGDAGVSSEANEPGNSPAAHTDACDFMCNGGIAILVTASVATAQPKPPFAPAIAAIARLLLPGSLERPPRSPVLA